MSGFNARIMPTKYVNKLSSLPFHRQLITTIKCHLGIIIIKLRGEMSHMKFIVFWALKLCWPQQEERANFFSMRLYSHLFLFYVYRMWKYLITRHDLFLRLHFYLVWQVTGSYLLFLVGLEVQKKKRKHSHLLSIVNAVNLVYSLMLYNEIHLDLETSNSENLIVPQYFMLCPLVTPLPGLFWQHVAI